MSAAKSLTKSLRNIPFHIGLLPVFFILKTQSLYAGLLGWSDLLLAFVLISLLLVILFLLFRFIFRNNVKAGIATTLTAILFLYFGNLKNVLYDIKLLNSLSHYYILLPIATVFIFFIYFRIKRNKPWFKSNIFLNLLFIIYILLELRNFYQPVSHTEIIKSKDTVLTSRDTNPDIWYLLFDCYPSSSFQKDVLGAENNYLDSTLIKRRFKVISHSTSNYNLTPFSMASIFNMQYLKWVSAGKKLEPSDYNRAIENVKRGEVFKELAERNYIIRNLSIFDIGDQPSLKKEHFLSTTSASMIYYQTLWGCFERDILPAIFPNSGKRLASKQADESKKLRASYKEYNKLVLDSLLKLNWERQTEGPKFVYAHLMLPHFPYFFDSTGKEYNTDLIFGKDMITNRERFANYINYTNNQLTALLDIIFAKGSKPVIIIQSDHGISDLTGKKDDAFRNYTAYFFPDLNYDLLNDKLSNVNTFRMIFNKYFGQQLPLLKDSSIYIK